MRLKEVLSYALHLVRQRPIGTPPGAGAAGEGSPPGEEASPASPPESGVWTFCRLVLPPLLLAPLVTFPMDFVLLLLWLIGWICLLTSSVSVLIRLLRLAFGDAAKRRSRTVALTRPLLTVGVVLGATLAVNHSLSTARYEAAKLATSIQAEVKKAGTCPENVPGWDLTDGWKEGSDGRKLKASRSSLGWTTHYTVVYETSEDRTTFTLRLRETMDVWTTFQGGPQTDLVATRSGLVDGGTPLDIDELLRR